MASTSLREELKCAICLSVYTDPVTLQCGHNFCRVCIDRVLDTQRGSRNYSCPECRDKIQERPVLQTNITLNNIVENFLFTQPDQEESGVFCTYCIHAPVPAVKSCLLCEASLCDNHLRVYSKSPDHIKRKCSIHRNKTLKYYCTKDTACICVSCYVIGEHRGHQMELRDEASEKKKKKLTNVLQEVRTQREETEKRLQRLQERRRKAEEKASSETERVTAMFRDLKRRLEDLEKRILRGISRQAGRFSVLYNGVIQELEVKKEELSRKMRHIEELCNMTDPLTVPQESDTGDLCDTEDRERCDGGDLDVPQTSDILHKGLSDIVTGINVCFYIQDAEDLLLDVNSANNYLPISDDGKTATYGNHSQNLPETPERFDDVAQVMSRQSFSSGRHYWEVDGRGTEWWRVGLCYPSIDRSGNHSAIGYNNKSWCLRRYYHYYLAIHDGKVVQLPVRVCSDQVRVYLDYEAGQISFYALCDPIRHIHTFTATFIEPLHAALGLWRGFIKISS